MRKAVIFALILICFAGVQAFAEGEDDIINGAVDALKEYWTDEVYGKYPDMYDDGYFEIKWCRVVYIKDDIDAELKDKYFDMDCFVEFFLLTDYFGSRPYYAYAGVSECVAVKSDGAYEVLKKNPLDMYRAASYNSDFSGIIESISDRGSEFNNTYLLLKQ